ncbi:MAG: hypothetical protein B7Z73_14720 [Planctomycetia bacterium 21-64-5]|nr:MAG: hypothetical protein B7Z73_14720 [Planctomycetia bacterium 21-64-5]
MAKPTPAKPTEARAGRLKSRLLDAGRVASHMAAWAGRNPLQAAIISGIVLLPVLPIVVVQWSLSRHLPKQPLVSDVEAALAALDKGDFSRAAEIAHSFGAEGPMTADELRVKPFLLGVAADHDAERLLGPQQRRLRAVAARYLSEARILGFFDGREAEGLFLLGKDLYESGQTAESVSVLEEALKSNPERLELHRLLAGAYLDQAATWPMSTFPRPSGSRRCSSAAVSSLPWAITPLASSRSRKSPTSLRCTSRWSSCGPCCWNRKPRHWTSNMPRKAIAWPMKSAARQSNCWNRRRGIVVRPTHRHPMWPI